MDGEEVGKDEIEVVKANPNHRNVGAVQQSVKTCRGQSQLSPSSPDFGNMNSLSLPTTLVPKIAVKSQRSPCSTSGPKSTPMALWHQPQCQILAMLARRYIADIYTKNALDMVTIRRRTRGLYSDGSERTITKMVRELPERLLPNGDVVVMRKTYRSYKCLGLEILTVL